MAELELSGQVDNKTKVETMHQEEAAIRQDNKEREMERLADAAEKDADALASVDTAIHSETLRDTAPVLEGIKVMPTHTCSQLRLEVV